MASANVPAEDALTAKLSLLDELIIQDILLAKARALKIELPVSELETAYSEAKKNISDEAFQQELTRRKVTADDMREGLRRELLAQKVIEQEVGSKVAVTDQEVSDFFNANRAQFNVLEEGYHLAQIVVTPVRDPQLANRTGDDATSPQAAQAKVQMLMERLKAGASFGDLAVGYSEDPESAQRGGDLGLVPMSRLKQAPPPLRDAVLQSPAGTVKVVSMGGAHSLILVVSHEPAGQRDLAMPAVKERITTGLRGRKEQLLQNCVPHSGPHGRRCRELPREEGGRIARESACGASGTDTSRTSEAVRTRHQPQLTCRTCTGGRRTILGCSCTSCTGWPSMARVTSALRWNSTPTTSTSGLTIIAATA